MSLTKRVVVSGYKEMDDFNLNVYFEIYNGQPWVINFDFKIDEVYVSGQYNDKIISYTVNGGFMTTEVMESVQNKLDEVKNDYKDEFPVSEPETAE